MAKRTILFRADGDPTIGMGHFTRTLALAEMLNEHFHCIYANRKPTEYQIAEIEKICHDRINLPEDDSHFDAFLNHLKGNEIVVLDNYYFTTNYQKAIKAKGCKLVCIDNMHSEHFYSVVVINLSGGITPETYSKEPYAKFLQGPYVLLRPGFLFAARNKGKNNRAKFSTLLISMGGNDYFNLKRKYLNAVSPVVDFSYPILWSL